MTLSFIERELMSDEGAFFSSIDADSDGIEGKFYVWTLTEIEQITESDSEMYSEYYSVVAEGNWEKGTNILHIQEDSIAIARKYGLTITDFYKKITSLNEKMRIERDKRTRPLLDDKILTAWNALMIKAYMDAYKIFGHEKYLNIALRNANFFVDKVIAEDGKMTRNYKNKKSTINGFLDDYSFTIEAFIALYQETFDEKWILLAKKLTDYSLKHFFDSKSGMFFYTSDLDSKLIARKMELHDNVIPASNSSMANNLFILSKIFYEDNYLEIAEQMLANSLPKLLQNGEYYSNWAILFARFAYGTYELALVGNKAFKHKKLIDKVFIPNVVYAGSEGESDIPLLKGRYSEKRSQIFVCQNKTCKMPVTKASDALKEILN